MVDVGIEGVGGQFVMAVKREKIRDCHFRNLGSKIKRRKKLEVYRSKGRLF